MYHYWVYLIKTVIIVIIIHSPPTQLVSQLPNS